MLKKVPISLFFLFLLVYSTLSANPRELFTAANQAYQDGNFQLAINNYEAILEKGSYSKAIYYNLGNAYFKSNNLGKAILNYERALLIDPRDDDTLFNLTLARENTADQLESIGKFFVTEWWQRLHKALSSNTWGVLTILFIWAGVGGLILWLFGNTRMRKKQGFIGGILGLSLSIILYFVTISQVSFEKNSRYGIILATEIELKNGPDQESTGILLLHQGLKMELMDQIGSWQKVKLSNGDQGWLPINSFEEI